MPVVMVTSSDEVGDKAEALRQGVEAYRVKPVSFAELLKLAGEIRTEAEDHCRGREALSLTLVARLGLAAGGLQVLDAPLPTIVDHLDADQVTAAGAGEGEGSAFEGEEDAVPAAGTADPGHVAGRAVVTHFSPLGSGSILKSGQTSSRGKFGIFGHFPMGKASPFADVLPRDHGQPQPQVSEVRQQARLERREMCCICCSYVESAEPAKPKSEKRLPSPRRSK
jgi:CheY-like chemotaxis protein